MKRLVLGALLSLAIIACKKDPVEPTPTPAATTGSLKVEFEPVADTNDLVFGTQNYYNANGDTFTVTLFRYYISNIVLTKSDNSTYTVVNAYYKIDHNTAGKNIITIGGVPFANYKAIQFLIGVDSLRNVSGAQEGALAPSDMFWDWNTGYIMAKLEGNSPQSTATANKFMYHVGGFTGANNVLKTVNLSFNSETANVTSSKTPELHLKADVLKWFTGVNTISIGSINVVHMPGLNAKKMADNYAGMFSYDHVHN